MIFTEPRFILFFLVVFAVHWALPSSERGMRARKGWLLLCSYAFYACWKWQFLSLIWFSTLVDYFAGLGIDRASTRFKRRAWLLVSLVANLGLLAVFKYFGFFVDSAIELIEFLGFSAHRPTLEIVLPVGISFYTFQTMSYSLDIYFGRLKPTRNLLDLALFVGFFPQLVAGPIVRAKEFMPQLNSPRLFERVEVRACLMLFLVGFVKKACISDNVVTLVDPYFANPGRYDALSSWVGVLMYAVQIYCDFSGYSDMAIASAGLLGYRLGINFNFPYLAADIREFWRRWHISLSTWLRDYLYVPLGGNRGNKLFTYRNLMLTMLLGGLWHGAGWNFVIWGGMHGLALVVQREVSQANLFGFLPAALRRGLGILLTFWWVCLAWVFFRSPDFDTALRVLRSFVLLGDADVAKHLSYGWLPLATLLGLIVAHVIGSTRVIGRATDRLPDWGFAVLYGILVPLALAFMNGAVQPFIYFQF